MFVVVHTQSASTRPDDHRQPGRLAPSTTAARPSRTTSNTGRPRYGSSTPDGSTNGSGSDQPVSATPGGLSPDTDYHVRLVADAPTGPVYGEDVAFHTARPGSLPGLPPGLDFTWSPRADVLVAGAPLGGVQFQATPGAGVDYQWSFDSPPGQRLRPRPVGLGRHAAPRLHRRRRPRHRRGRTAPTASAGACTPCGCGPRRPTAPRSRSRTTWSSSPNAPPLVDFTVGGAQNANQPTALTPTGQRPGRAHASPTTSTTSSGASTRRRAPTRRGPAVDLICRPTARGATRRTAAAPGPWFSQGNGHQAVVNFFQRGLAVHGLPELSTLNIDALPQTAPDGSPLTGGLRVLDGQGLFTVYHDLRVAYLYDNATLLQQTSFAHDAGEATGAQLKSGAPLTAAHAQLRPSSTRDQADRLQLDDRNRPTLACACSTCSMGMSSQWRQVTLTAVDTAGVRTLRHPLGAATAGARAGPARELHRRERSGGLTVGRRRTIHLAARALSRRTPRSSTTADHGRRWPSTPAAPRTPGKDRLLHARGRPATGVPEPRTATPSSTTVGSRSSTRSTRPSMATGRGVLRPALRGRRRLGLAAGRTGKLAAWAPTRATSWTSASAAAGAPGPESPLTQTGLPTLGEKLCPGPVTTLRRRRRRPGLRPRNVFPSVFMAQSGVAARPPVRPHDSVSLPPPRGRAMGYEFATTALVTTDPSKLRFRIPVKGTYSVTVAAYNDAGLGAIQRTDNFVIDSRTKARAIPWPGRLKLGGPRRSDSAATAPRWAAPTATASGPQAT